MSGKGKATVPEPFVCWVEYIGKVKGAALLVVPLGSDRPVAVELQGADIPDGITACVRGDGSYMCEADSATGKVVPGSISVVSWYDVNAEPLTENSVEKN